MDDITPQPHRPGSEALTVVLLVAQVLLDCFLLAAGMFVSACSVREHLAARMFDGLAVVLLAVLVASLVLSGRDADRGRRSPAHWPAVGLCVVAVVGFVFFLVLSGFGTAQLC